MEHREQMARWLHMRFGENQASEWEDLSDTFKQAWLDLAGDAPESGDEELPWEYSPGHRWEDRDGEEHWFVQSGTIAPGYVETYIEEGGEVVRRRVGAYEVYAK